MAHRKSDSDIEKRSSTLNCRIDEVSNKGLKAIMLHLQQKEKTRISKADAVIFLIHKFIVEEMSSIGSAEA